MSTIDALERVLKALRAGGVPDETDLKHLEGAVRDQRKKQAMRLPTRKVGRPRRSAEDDLRNIFLVMHFLELVQDGVEIQKATQMVAGGSRNLLRHRRRYGKIAQGFIEDDRALDSMESEDAPTKPDAKEEFKNS